MKVNFSSLKKYDMINIKINETMPGLKKDIKILLTEEFLLITLLKIMKLIIKLI